MVAAQPDGGASAAGIRRQRHHERKRGAGPLRLPDAYAGPRLRPQRARGRNGVHARADHCLRDPFGRNMAVAVCDQYSLRRGRNLDRPEDPAANAARSARVRFSERGLDRELPRPLLHRHRQRGASGFADPGRTGACRRHAARLADDPPACGPSGADVADRPVQASHVRAVRRDLGLFVRGAGTGVRFTALLLRRRAAAVASGNRLLHDVRGRWLWRSWRRSGAGCRTAIRSAF